MSVAAYLVVGLMFVVTEIFLSTTWLFFVSIGAGFLTAGLLTAVVPGLPYPAVCALSLLIATGICGCAFWFGRKNNESEMPENDLIGAFGTTLTELKNNFPGKVSCSGTDWVATSESGDIAIDTPVNVVRIVNGNQLIVAARVPSPAAAD